MKSRAITLVEALVAIFLLCSALLVSCNLFHAGMQYNRRADERILTARLAQNKLEEIVGWARGRVGTTYNYADWSLYDGATGTFPEAPRVHYAVTVEDVRLADPCSSFQAVAAADRQHSVGVKRVHVRAWQSGPALELSTLVRPPVREMSGALQVAAVGSPASPLPKDDTASFSVTALDVGGNQVPDLTYQWYVISGTGSGTLAQTWDGSQGDLVNVIQVPLHPPVYTGGSCSLRVRARYAGLELWGDSPDVPLVGP